MPLGAARLTLLAKSSVTAVAEVIRKKVGLTALQQVQVSTAQSKFGGASALFDGGTDDYILVDHTAQNITYGDDFTYECWINFNTLPTVFAMLNTGSTRGDYLAIYLKSGTWTIAAAISDGSTATTQIRNLGFTPVTGTWYHVAFVKEGSAVRFYVDGTEKTTDNGSGGTLTADKGWDGVRRIGDWQNPSNYAFNGYMDEIRFSKTVRYTSGFTPSTTAFTNDDNTLLLVHADGTSGSTFFEDDNGVGRSAVGLTALGNAQVDTAQSKFGVASGLFDGTGDGINCNKPLLSATGDWTVEMWVYPTSIAATDYFFTQYSLGAAGRTGMYHTNTGAVGLFINGGPSYTTTGTISTGSWQHLAWVRNGSSFKTYINGTEEGSGTGSPSIQQIDSIVGKINSSGGTDDFIGNIDEVRISDTARYTSGFTPSTTPFVNDANTLLLLHMDGTDGSTDFRDDNGTGRSAIDLTAIGNAQIDTAQSQFGGSSLLLDGTGDWLKHNDDNGTFQFGSNDFTIEAWINPSAIYTTGSPIEPIWNKYNTSNSQRMLSFGIYDGFLGYFWASSGASGNAVQTTQAISTGSWKHVALCREGNTWNTYYDGTRVDTRTLAVTLHASTEPVYIGSYFGTANNEINGYIDELRVSDSARYTGASYTVPTEPFQNDTNTLLLLHMNGTDGSTTFIDDNGVTTAGTGA